MKNILWLTEWWPNELEPFSGDGIERRAKAASLYNNIVVIFIKKNPSLRFGKVKWEERIYNDNLRAWIYYYPSIGRFSRFLDMIYSNYWFIRLHRRGLRTFKKIWQAAWSSGKCINESRHHCTYLAMVSQDEVYHSRGMESFSSGSKAGVKR